MDNPEVVRMFERLGQVGDDLDRPPARQGTVHQQVGQGRSGDVG